MPIPDSHLPPLLIIGLAVKAEGKRRVLMKDSQCNDDIQPLILDR